MPDGGGQGEDALQDAGGDAVDGPPAVAFEVELAAETARLRAEMGPAGEIPSAGHR